jgi:hypothetical protein
MAATTAQPKVTKSSRAIIHRLPVGSKNMGTSTFFAIAPPVFYYNTANKNSNLYYLLQKLKKIINILSAWNKVLLQNQRGEKK